MAICIVDSNDVIDGNIFINNKMNDVIQCVSLCQDHIRDILNADITADSYRTIKLYCQNYVLPILESLILLADMMKECSLNHQNGLFECGGINTDDGIVNASLNVILELRHRLEYLGRRLDHFVYLSSCAASDSNFDDADMNDLRSQISTATKELEKKQKLYDYESTSAGKFDKMILLSEKVINATDTIKSLGEVAYYNSLFNITELQSCIDSYSYDIETIKKDIYPDHPILHINSIYTTPNNANEGKSGTKPIADIINVENGAFISEIKDGIATISIPANPETGYQGGISGFITEEELKKMNPNLKIEEGLFITAKSTEVITNYDLQNSAVPLKAQEINNANSSTSGLEKQEETGLIPG